MKLPVARMLPTITGKSCLLLLSDGNGYACKAVPKNKGDSL